MTKPAVIRSRATGYTLMEIMLVVAIIAVIAGGVIVKMTGALDVAKFKGPNRISTTFTAR